MEGIMMQASLVLVMIDFSALLKTLLIDREKHVEMNWNKWKSEQYINGQWKAGNSAFCYASVSKHGHPHVVSIKFPSNSPVSNSNFWLVKVSIKIAIVSSRIPLNCWRREFLFLAHIDRNNAVFIIITIAITMCCT